MRTAEISFKKLSAARLVEKVVEEKRYQEGEEINLRSRNKSTVAA